MLVFSNVQEKCKKKKRQVRLKINCKLQKIKDHEGGLIKLLSSTQTSFQIYSWSFQDEG